MTAAQHAGSPWTACPYSLCFHSSAAGGAAQAVYAASWSICARTAMQHGEWHTVWACAEVPVLSAAVDCCPAMCCHVFLRRFGLAAKVRQLVDSSSCKIALVWGMATVAQCGQQCTQQRRYFTQLHSAGILGFLCKEAPCVLGVRKCPAAAANAVAGACMDPLAPARCGRQLLDGPCLAVLSAPDDSGAAVQAVAGQQHVHPI